MARIEPVPLQDVDPGLNEIVSQARDRLPQFMNQVLTLAHRPRLAHDLVTLYLGFQDDSRLDRSMVELAVLTVSYENRCVYCVSHHAPLGEQAGLSPEAISDLEARRIEESLHFSATEKLVIAYAQQITRDARRVPRKLFSALQECFADDQIVELTVRIALANFFNRLNDALQIDIEPGVEVRL